MRWRLLLAALVGALVWATLVGAMRVGADVPALVRRPGVRAWTWDRAVDASVVDDLLGRLPSMSDARVRSATLRPLGRALAERWNAPADESFWKQGVVVDDAPDLGPSTIRALEAAVGRAVRSPVRLVEARVKDHLPRSPGVWLHTDRQAGSRRHVQALLYLCDLRRGDGGVCHVFSHRKTRRAVQYVRYVPAGERVDGFRRAVVAAAVGGEGPRGVRSFRSELEVVPQRGRLLVMDCRDADNVHAVTAMASDRRRALLEAWFEVIAPSWPASSR